MRSAIRSFDSVGMFMLIATLTFLIVALNLAGDAFPWDSSVIIGLFVASAVGFVVFILVERRASKPIVPTHLFAQMNFRNVPIMTAVRCLLFFHLYATTFYVPIFLQVTGKPEILAAALVIPFLLMAALASTVTNIIASTYGLVRPIFMAALAILPVGMGLMSTLNDKSPIGQVVGYTLISGLGFGSGTQLSIVIAQVGLGSDLLPTVTAFISATPNLGGVLGVGIVGTVINSAFRSNLSKHISNTGITLPHINDAVLASKDPIIGHNVISAYVSAFKLGFQILAGIAALQFVLCLGLRRVELAGHIDSKENAIQNVDSEKTPTAVQEKETMTTKLGQV
ncbi:major facilitator superfamily domain-containing protein [Abortiporus biennis]|nr:major facilitator superfamily domain-containing protein [Abortiporus biennis]